MARAFDTLIDEELRRRNTPGMSPYDQVASSGQKYKDLPFNERFGGPYEYVRDPEEIKRRFQEELLIDRIQKDREAPGQTPGQMIRPGYKERFRDETKVISSLGGQQFAQASGGTATDALPPGFSYVEATPGGLPPGFSYVDAPTEKKPVQQPAPVAPQVPQRSPLEGVPLSADPAEQAREVAALRTGARGRTPGPVTGAIESFLPEVGAGMATGARRFMADTERLQEPENALATALGGPVAPGIAAMRGGAAMTRTLGEGGFQGIDSAAAAKTVREGVAGGGATVTPRMTLLANEDSIGQMASMARTGSPEDLKALARLRRVVPAERQAEVQGALVQRLGARGDSGEFSAGAFVRNYGKISDRAKNILFGEGGSGSLRQHLDSIAEVTERAPTWRGPSARTIAGTATAASALGGFVGGAKGAVLAPLAVLGTMLPVKAVAMALTSPATAASVAAWSRAYERAVRTGGNAALVSFNLATRNLNNTLGVNVDPKEALGGARGQSVE